MKTAEKMIREAILKQGFGSDWNETETLIEKWSREQSINSTKEFIEEIAKAYAKQALESLKESASEIHNQIEVVRVEDIDKAIQELK